MLFATRNPRVLVWERLQFSECWPPKSGIPNFHCLSSIHNNEILLILKKQKLLFMYAIIQNSTIKSGIWNATKPETNFRNSQRAQFLKRKKTLQLNRPWVTFGWPLTWNLSLSVTIEPCYWIYPNGHMQTQENGTSVLTRRSRIRLWPLPSPCMCEFRLSSHVRVFFMCLRVLLLIYASLTLGIRLLSC